MSDHNSNHGHHQHGHGGSHGGGHGHHYILPTWAAVAVGAALLVLTVVTVAVAHVDLGRLNFTVAMLVATVKGLLVAMIFMNLRNDRKENAVIFATSFLFLAIFIVLTGTDLFFRGDVYVKGPIVPEQKSKIVNPWIETPQLLAKGKVLYETNCATCHGTAGKGDGPAAGALNPKPRDFTAEAGWKNGRKITEIFKTLKEGIPGTAMASFATLAADDRWALGHFVQSLGPKAPAAGDQDFAKIGINPKEGGAEKVAASIPVELAMSRMATAPEPKKVKGFPGSHGFAPGDNMSPGARLYQQNCASCHGARGEGGQVVKNLGVNPTVEIRTMPLSAEAVGSQDAFVRVVSQGLPGSLMPGSSDLSASQIRDIYGYVKTLSAR